MLQVPTEHSIERSIECPQCSFECSNVSIDGLFSVQKAGGQTEVELVAARKVCGYIRPSIPPSTWPLLTTMKLNCQLLLS